MTHDSTTTMTGNIQIDPTATTGGDDLFILLCAPSHDDLTDYTSKLFDNFPNLGAPTLLHKFESPLKYDHLLSGLPIDPEKTEVALIFCGHGEPSSLLGPGTSPDTPDYRQTFSSFYDDSFLHLGPKLMLAFCCSAAVGLGHSYDCKTINQTFIGFDSEIGIIKKGGIYANWWRKILRGSAAAMLNATDRNEMEKSIRELYRDAISFFDSPAGRRYQLARAMKWYLLAQSKALKVFQS